MRCSAAAGLAAASVVPDMLLAFVKTSPCDDYGLRAGQRDTVGIAADERPDIVAMSDQRIDAVGADPDVEYAYRCAIENQSAVLVVQMQFFLAGRLTRRGVAVDCSGSGRIGHELSAAGRPSDRLRILADLIVPHSQSCRRTHLGLMHVEQATIRCAGHLDTLGGRMRVSADRWLFAQQVRNASATKALVILLSMAQPTISHVCKSLMADK